MKIQRFKDFFCRLHLALPIDKKERSQFFLAQENILVDLKLRNQAKFLLNHGDAGPESHRVERSQIHRLASYENLSLEILDQPRGNFH